MLRKGRPRATFIAGALALVFSHAGVLWLGLRHGQAGASTIREDSSQAEAGVSPEQSRAFTGELLARNQARVVRDEAAAAEKEAQEKIPAAERMAAARAEIPADTDLRALLDEAIRDDEKRSSPRAAALLDLWLDRDAEAALDWLGAAAWNQGLTGFDHDSPISRWLGTGDRLAQLPALLDRHYAAQEMLMESAGTLMDERGAETAVALLRLFENGERRHTVIEELTRWGMSRIAGKLPAIGAVLGHDELRELLEELSWRTADDEEKPEGPKIAEYLRQRFPRGLPADFEPFCESREQNLSLPDLAAQEPPRAPIGWEEDIQSALKAGREWGNYSGRFTSAVPDFHVWCADAADGRMAPDEVHARLRAAWPAAKTAEMERAMEVMVFRGIFPGNPTAGLRWFREKGGDWGKEMSAGLSRVAPEGLLQLAAEFPDLTEAGGEDFAEQCERKLVYWYEQDPEGCQAGIRRAPASFLRDAAIKLSAEDGP